MKNLADVETRLRTELSQWFTRQCDNVFASYYLYYLPSSAEHDGGLLIAEDKPANSEYVLVDAVHRGSTVEQNFNNLRLRCPALPILSIKG